ncbi:somatostatin receptor type 5 isoform X3 [Stigmatopora argus]
MEPLDVLNFSSPYANVSSGMFITQSIPFQGSSTLLTGVIYITVFLLGLVGNSLAIYVVLRHAKMKTNVLSYWPFGSILCRLVMTADSMTQFTSVFCLTVMSVDRYLAVVHPIRSSKWRHTRVAKAVSAGVWAASFVVVLPVVIFSDVQETFNSCNMIWPEPADVWSTAFILYTSAVGFFGPVLIICFCYLLIVFKVCLHVCLWVLPYPWLHFPICVLISTQVKSSGKCAGLTSRRRSERKVTRMVMVIVLVFVLCWLPFFIINIVNLVVIIPESSAAAGVYFLAVILSYANSCANPLLYGFLCDNFKQSFRKVLCLKRIRCKANGVAHTDPSARRMVRSMPTDCAPQSQVSNHPGSSQATGLHISHTTADLHFCASACNPLLSTDLQYPRTAATITESPKSATAEIPTISTVTGVPAIF